MSDWCDACDAREAEVDVDGEALCPGCVLWREKGLPTKREQRREDAQKGSTRLVWLKGIYNGPVEWDAGVAVRSAVSSSATKVSVAPVALIWA